MADVTVIILTKDEEINLPDCLRSIEGFSARTVVVDSGSADRTVEIAREMGAEVLYHPFETHARQFNWALDNVDISTGWTCRLDADERLTPELIAEFNALMQAHESDDVNGFTTEAWLYFLGRRIRYGCHNKRKLLLFRTGKARSEDRRIDEHTLLTEGRSVSAKHRFIHYDFKDMTHWINKMNWYATREMEDYMDYVGGTRIALGQGDDEILRATQKKKFGFYYRFPKFFRCWLLFIYYYIFRLGFLDGREGYVYHYMYHRWYRSLVDAKILERELTEKKRAS